MSRNERQTCKDLIEPALTRAGWEWEEQVSIGPGRVNLSGDSMYDESQAIVADYLLRYQNVPLAVVEAKAEGEQASDGIQQGSRYAQRLGIRHSFATNGVRWILTDNETGEFSEIDNPPTPEELLRKLGVAIDWERWRSAFTAAYHVDQVTRKEVRPYQDMAIFKTLWTYARGDDRALLLMATGTGKTFTVFQLVWKLMNGGVLPRQHILFLTDRNSLKDQAYRAFNAFQASERVTVDRETVTKGRHTVGKVFFANYQNLDEDLDGKKLYEHFDPDFFDLVVVDECHRSGFGDWFGVLEHFSSALQLGLTATPRELEESRRALTDQEKRRDTYHYFGEPIFTYSLRQAIEDGYLVPYLLEERITNLDAEGFTGPDGRHYTTSDFEREIRLPDRTRAIAEDLWTILGQYGLRDEKTIVFCVDDTHAAFMAAEFRRLSGDPDYAARVTRAERNSHQLERNFAIVGPGKPRLAVTVDLLTTGFDAPDVKNIVFVRPLRSSILYKQMKGRGTRLCEDINKRYFTIFDYSGASQLEDTEFDGHPANKQKVKTSKPKRKPEQKPREKPVEEGVSVLISDTDRYVCLADGRKIPFDEYTERSREHLLDVASESLDALLAIWIDKKSRHELREDLRDHDIYPSAFRHYLGLDATDDVDVLAKIAFSLARVPTRHQRVVRFWDHEADWIDAQYKDGEKTATPPVTPFPGAGSGREQQIAAEGGSDADRFKRDFWRVALDHYALFGIDDLEKAQTYGAPQFVEQFGSFQTLTRRYGGPQQLKADLEAVKYRLYVPMAI